MSRSETAPATAATSSPVSRAVNSAHAAHSRKTVAAPIAVPALCRAVHGANWVSTTSATASTTSS